MGKAAAVFGIYTKRVQVDKAVETLRTDGFRTTDISALFPDNAGNKDYTYGSSSETAVAGLGAGAAIGGALGLLAGSGGLAVPGFGPFITAGATSRAGGRWAARWKTGWGGGSYRRV